MGGQMERVLDAMVDRARSRLDIPTLRKLFGDVVACLGAMVERFCTALDCVNTGFIPDDTLDELPLPTTIGTSRIGGIDLNKPRARSAVAAALALSAAPEGLTVGDLAARARAMAGLARCDYTVRQAAYDLRKLRAKKLLSKNGRSRRYTVPADAARTMAALLVLRQHVVGPILAGCRVPMRGRRPNTWTTVDQHYEAIRGDMVALFDEIGLTRGAPVAAWTTSCRSSAPSA
ncbi:MAG: hypothetical protein ABR511_07150 [Acidimicrobiales bacterium]